MKYLSMPSRSCSLTYVSGVLYSILYPYVLHLGLVVYMLKMESVTEPLHVQPITYVIHILMHFLFDIPIICASSLKFGNVYYVHQDSLGFAYSLGSFAGTDFTEGKNVWPITQTSKKENQTDLVIVLQTFWICNTLNSRAFLCFCL